MAHIQNMTDIPEAMGTFYRGLASYGFLNTTPPTPAEWERAEAPGMQIQLSHVGRTCTVRYRLTPPEPDEPIHSVEEHIARDRKFPWSELSHTEVCTREEFVGFLVRTLTTIGLQVQSRLYQSQL